MLSRTSCLIAVARVTVLFGLLLTLSPSPVVDAGWGSWDVEEGGWEPISEGWDEGMTPVGTRESAGEHDPQRGEAVQWMPNPAAVYCSKLGYHFRVVEGADGGQHGVCTLPDETTCEAWDFLQGTCGEAFSVCAHRGWETEVRADGQNAFSQAYAVCVDPATSEARPVSEMVDLAPAPQGFELELESEPQAETLDAGPADGPEAAADLPVSFDWRDYEGGDWTTPVKDQGICGSCWAFSSVAVVEAAHNLDANDPDLDPNLSEQYLVTDCAVDAGTCAGGDTDPALSFIRDQGVPDEACLPYLDGDYSNGCTYVDGDNGAECDASVCTYSTDPECSDYRCADRCGDWASRLSTIGGVTFLNNPSREDVKQALTTHGPLAVGMGYGYGTFVGGIYDCQPVDPSQRNHGVAIVGYDDAGQYWIVRNNWGSDWNGDGHFKVGYGECAIEADAYYVDAASDVSVEDISSRWRTSSANPDPDDDPSTPNYDPLYDLDGDGIITVLDIMEAVAP